MDQTHFNKLKRQCIVHTSCNLQAAFFWSWLCSPIHHTPHLYQFSRSVNVNAFHVHHLFKVVKHYCVKCLISYKRTVFRLSPVFRLSKLINPSGSSVDIYIVSMTHKFAPQELQHIAKQQPPPRGPPIQFSSHFAPQQCSKQNFSRQQSSGSAASCRNIRSFTVRMVFCLQHLHLASGLRVPAGPHQLGWQHNEHWFIKRICSKWSKSIVISSHKSSDSKKETDYVNRNMM